MKEYGVIAVSLGIKSELMITVQADEAEKTDDIILCVSIGGTVFSANSHSYFVAFQKIRDKLLQQGYGLKCIGARIDVVQSAMASATNKVYITALGNQALKKDLKCLFDYADISEFPNTKEQNEYLEKWIESLG